MNRKTTPRIALAAGLFGLLAATAASCLVAVDEAEYAVVTEFGRVVAVHGGDEGGAGLHPIRPWQGVTRVDRRLRALELPAREVITGDRRNLEVAAYLVYRVADPVAFLRGSVSLELAEARLNERVAAALSAAIGRRDLAALASVGPKRWGGDDVAGEVRGALADAAREDLGLAILDLGLRRFNHPLEVRPAIFELIRSERRQAATRLRAEGEAEYVRLTSDADRQRDAILAQADAEAERIRGRAEADATRILNEAQGRDPRFYEFLRTLESYASILDPKATVVLSASSPLLRLLERGPDPALLAAPPDAASTAAGAGP